jgi:hypothetical protein
LSNVSPFSQVTGSTIFEQVHASLQLVWPAHAARQARAPAAMRANSAPSTLALTAAVNEVVRALEPYKIPIKTLPSLRELASQGRKVMRILNFLTR